MTSWIGTRRSVRWLRWREVQGRLIIVANAGRSGSTFLFRRLQEAANGGAYVAHEDIPVQVSRPRKFNRAYDPKSVQAALNDPKLKIYLNRWKEITATRDVIETGWTCYHLLPVLHKVFGHALRVVVLHRDPWSVALSRASMGNYHPRTWYDEAHEVSPFDVRSIAPHYSAIWAEMNHAEKCLFWWYVVYEEVLEFLSRNPDIEHHFLASEEMFRGEGFAHLSEFLKISLHRNQSTMGDDGRNEVNRFLTETFPITDEHQQFARHSGINQFAAEQFGYIFSSERISTLALKYQLPPGPMPHLRHSIDFWTWRRRIGRILRLYGGK